MHDIQLSIFPAADRIAIDKNFSPDLKRSKDIHKSDGPQWKMDFEKSFDIPREQINDIIIFLLKKCYDNPLDTCIKFTINEISAFHEKTPQNYFRLTVTDKPDFNPTTNEEYVNNLEVILHRLTTRNLILGTEYIIRESQHEEKYSGITSLQIITRFEKKMIDGKTKAYSVTLHPGIIRNMASFFFYTSLEDYKKVSQKAKRAGSWKLLYLRLSNIFNNLNNNRADHSSFEELTSLLNLNPNTAAPQKKNALTKAITELLQLPSLKGLHFKWAKSGAQKFAYTPQFTLNQEEAKSNHLLETEEAKFKRVDIFLINLLREWNIPISKKHIKENTSFVYKALYMSYQMTINRELTAEESHQFFDQKMYKGKYKTALESIL